MSTSKEHMDSDLAIKETTVTFYHEKYFLNNA